MGNGSPSPNCSQASFQRARRLTSRAVSLMAPACLTVRVRGTRAQREQDGAATQAACAVLSLNPESLMPPGCPQPR